jgi:hypothetical protein
MSSPTGDGEAAPLETARVVAGEYELDVGVPGGSRLALIPPESRKQPGQLADALGPPGGELRPPVDFLKGVVDEGSKAADDVDRAVALITAASQDAFANLATINVEIDVVLGALSRLDRDGRYEDEIELARTLADLLALLERWWELVQTLLHAFDAAKHLAGEHARDHAQAWALHELGSLSACAGRPARAHDLLGRARDIRIRIDDHQGLAATTQNMTLAGPRVVAAPPRPRWRASGRRWCMGGAAAALLTGGALGAVGYHYAGGSGSSPQKITLLADPKAGSITFSGLAATSGYNHFVEVRVIKPDGTVLRATGPQRLTPSGSYGGRMTFAPRLPPGQYYAQASQGRRGSTAPHLKSNAFWFVIARLAPLSPTTTATSPPPPAMGLAIESPVGTVSSYPNAVSGTSTGLAGDYVQVKITASGLPDGPQPEPTDVRPIASDGSWKVDIVRTKFLTGLSYTAVAYIVDQDGNLAQNPLESRAVHFTWAPQPIVSVPVTAGT